jgi:Ser/Thr protein kinase RdoA (MazF antagonist)
MFEETVAPLLDHLRRSCIHGDMNDYNILVDEDSSAVVGIIDFGDMVHSYTVADLSIALAYVVLNNDSPLTAAANVVGSYREAFPLSEKELDSVWGLMLMRLCMSVCIAAYQLRQRPDNAYLEISQQAIKNRLPALIAIRPNALKQALR